MSKLDIANEHLSHIKDNTANLNASLSGLGGKLDNIANKVQDNTQNTGQRLDKIIDLLDYSDHNPNASGQASAGTGAGLPMMFPVPRISTGLNRLPRKVLPPASVPAL